MIVISLSAIGSASSFDAPSVSLLSSVNDIYSSPELEVEMVILVLLASVDKVLLSVLLLLLSAELVVTFPVVIALSITMSSGSLVVLGVFIFFNQANFDRNGGMAGADVAALASMASPSICLSGGGGS